MSVEELNPNHEVVGAMRDQWHKVLAAYMLKLGVRRVVISPRDVERLGRESGGVNLVAQELADGLHIRIVDDREAKRLAAQAGGLPS